MDILQRVFDWNEQRNNTTYDRTLEVKMLIEELQEYVEAADEVQELDAIADLLFVAAGTLFKFSEKHGIDPVRALEIVCNANDAKGTDKDSHGKIRKPNWFSKPDAPGGPLEQLLRAAALDKLTAQAQQAGGYE
jgi:predicted HAD superfamily Cof-like phosphohydrolase